MLSLHKRNHVKGISGNVINNTIIHDGVVYNRARLQTRHAPKIIIIIIIIIINY